MRDGALSAFQDLLARELAAGLPGRDIQYRMAPSDRVRLHFPEEPGGNTRQAAVMILLYPRLEVLHTLLIKRPDYPGIHGGQISLPGGKAEPADRNIEETALRETMEETGTDPGDVRVLGKLTSLFIPVSDTLVTPVVGALDRAPKFSPHPGEVEYLIEVPLRELADPSVILRKIIEIERFRLDVPYYDIGGNHIWGATAMILSEFVEIVLRPGLRSLW